MGISDPELARKHVFKMAPKPHIRDWRWRHYSVVYGCVDVYNLMLAFNAALLYSSFENPRRFERGNQCIHGRGFPVPTPRRLIAG